MQNNDNIHSMTTLCMCALFSIIQFACLLFIIYKLSQRIFNIIILQYCISIIFELFFLSRLIKIKKKKFSFAILSFITHYVYITQFLYNINIYFMCHSFVNFNEGKIKCYVFPIVILCTY